MKTPVEIANELEMNAHLTRDQAETIAAEIYQPLVDELKQVRIAILELSTAMVRPALAMDDYMRITKRIKGPELSIEKLKKEFDLE